MITRFDLNELKFALQKATPGNWYALGDALLTDAPTDDEGLIGYEMLEADAYVCALAKNHLPQLLDNIPVQPEHDGKWAIIYMDHEGDWTSIIDLNVRFPSLDNFDAAMTIAEQMSNADLNIGTCFAIRPDTSADEPPIAFINGQRFIQH